jgi:hypothetical protein
MTPTWSSVGSDLIDPLLALDATFVVPIPAPGRALVVGGVLPRELSSSLAARGVVVTMEGDDDGATRFDLVLSFRILPPSRTSLSTIRRFSRRVSPAGVVVLAFANPLDLVRARGFGAIRLVSGLLAHRAIQRVMSEAGLVLRGVHGVFPSLAESRTLVPLDDRRTTAYYLSYVLYPSVRWVRERILRLFHTSYTFRAIAPGYLVWGTPR